MKTKQDNNPMRDMKWRTPSGQPVISVGEPPSDEKREPIAVEQERIDLNELRARLEKQHGPEYWRNLEELASDESFREQLKAEFPQQTADWDPVNRRDFMKLMGASLALAGLAACTKQPSERIVPYVKPPEEMIPGQALYYATAMTFGGYAMGVLAESNMGRPTKIEGNPQHPATLGGTNVFMQASILGLYDPDRSQAVMKGGSASTWEAFIAALNEALVKQSAKQGAGLRILTETITSPTLASQISKLQSSYPQAKWHQYEAANRDHVRAGAKLAFGEIVDSQYHFEKADVVLSLDSDFLSSGPGQLKYARDFTSRRDVSGAGSHMNRLYVVESAPTLAGAIADHRLAIPAHAVEQVARAIANELGVDAGHDAAHGVVTEKASWIHAVAKDLSAHKSSALVVAGDHQSPAVHAIAHAINQALGAVGTTVSYIEPVEASPVDQTQSISELVADMKAGKVDTLIVLGANPVFDAPVDLEFGKHLASVGFRAHLGLYADETALACDWHIPEAHYLEAWSDARAFDGTASIVQPLIEPLYVAKSAHEFLEAVAGKADESGLAIVQGHWKGKGFEGSWRKALHDGVMPGVAATAKSVTASTSVAGTSANESRGGLELNFRPDPSIWDGRFANNGWLQETPKPFSKLTWDNAALMSVATAQELGLTNGDVVELSQGGRKLALPVWVDPGHAKGSVTVHLGYGRRNGGQVAKDVGANAYALRTSQAPWFAGGLEVRKTGATHLMASTQQHHLIDQFMVGKKAVEDRKFVRYADLEHFEAHPDFAQHMTHEFPEELTLYKGYDYSKGNQWGMTVNLEACIGCNACAVACQAENNIPVVGKEEVLKGREMNWIRIDRYYQGDPDDPKVHHQPVMCMHCENAACELVCPVGATVHSKEGLNQMVYNRCVGTRYCSNNCPYKVRRFNYFQYTDLETPQKKLQRNPDVTVRVRGVMEKCTYCVQRINAARIEAKKEDRAVRDGEVVTACQQACPTKAITFGNVIDPDSSVAKMKQSPLNYGLLTDLNMRPRTTYLAKVMNPNPALGGHASPVAGH